MNKLNLKPKDAVEMTNIGWQTVSYVTPNGCFKIIGSDMIFSTISIKTHLPYGEYVEVWGDSIEDKYKKIFICIESGFRCVNSNCEEEFREGGRFSITRWENCRPIPQEPEKEIIHPILQAAYESNLTSEHIQITEMIVEQLHMLEGEIKKLGPTVKIKEEDFK